MLPYILLLLFLSTAQARPTRRQDSNSTSHLDRRECVRKKDSLEYDCDFQLPSVAQIVEHLYHPLNGQGVNDQRPALFYSNLAYPEPLFDERMVEWVLGWVKKKGFVEGSKEQGNENWKFYWYYGPFDEDWYQVQTDHVEINEDDIRSFYPDTYLDSGQTILSPDAMLQQCLYQALAVAAIHPEAYIFAPKVLNPWSTFSYWAEIEYPALTANPNIQTIYHVDPQPLQYKKAHQDPLADVGPVQPPPYTRPLPKCGEEEKLDEPTVLWSRARGDKPIPPRWSCPIGTDIFPLLGHPPAEKPPPAENPPPAEAAPPAEAPPQVEARQAGTSDRVGTEPDR